MAQLKKVGPSAVSLVQQEITVSNPVQILEPS